MIRDRSETDDIGARGQAMARMPTGAKLFLVLSAALLPLALIAVFAALQTTRSADLQNRARLRVAAIEASRTLAIELVGDTNALRAALDAIDRDPADAPSCARARGVFAQSGGRGTRFAIYDTGGRLRCGSAIAGAVPVDSDRQDAQLIEGGGLVLSVAGRSGRSRASASFPASFLEELAQPSGFVTDYGLELKHGADGLPLRALPGSRLAPQDRMTVPLGIEDLSLQMTVPSAPITSPVLVAMLLPILMWAAAAGIGWFVVDRTLIRPLRSLRQTVGSYTPGTVLDVTGIETTHAQEIRELGETFRELSETLVAHENDLAEGLVRQTKLTREVHHRVKNNLQVIASLINFHARSAVNSEVTDAYATIQRRVDALAVVHRNHFAELEVHRGLSLRAMIGELTANIRATASDNARQLGIALEVEPFLVSQDTAVAVAFLVTEIVELAMNASRSAQLRISLRPSDTPDRAVLRVSSPALIEADLLRQLLSVRYGRVMEGLSRQLRSKLHHDPLAGAFEIAVMVTGRD